MLESLKEKVYIANVELKKNNLITLTWGNASAISEDGKYVVIKPSGVSYDTMTANDMVVTDLDGNIVDLLENLAIADQKAKLEAALNNN